jgi:triosephosphate isomerase
VTNQGQVDMTVFFEDRVYVFEFKVIEMTEAGSAQQQIKDKRYYEKYLTATSTGSVTGTVDKGHDLSAGTGSVSAGALCDLGVSSVIVGHSERRALGDGNEVVAKKMKQALASRLRPILCVGEKERDVEGTYLGFLKEQIISALVKVPPELVKLITIAYEPVWAIGKDAKSAATPGDFLEKSIFIRRVIADLYDQKIATMIPILYGGSVDETNASSFLGEGKAQGLLVGRASLDPRSFGAIIKSVNNI